MTISSKLFKKYDIRGVALGENALLTPDAVRQIGAGFGTFIQRTEGEGIVVVGHDNRLSSPSLYQTLIDGLRHSGCTVIALGQTATPIVYWHAVNLDSVAGVMVTGSHLGADQNGLKFCVGNRAIYGDDLQAIRQLIESGDLMTGIGGISFHHDAQQKYIESLRQKVLSSKRQLRVVIDAGNGMGGVIAPALIRAWGHEVVAELFCEPDGNYPNHPANPQEAETLTVLSETVRRLGADLGIAFDVTAWARWMKTGWSSRRIGCSRCWRGICSHGIKVRVWWVRCCVAKCYLMWSSNMAVHRIWRRVVMRWSKRR